MKKISRIEKAQEIIANLRQEMDRPRLTESVRRGLSEKTPPTLAPTARFKRLLAEQTSSS
jgi:hypothetical protein